MGRGRNEQERDRRGLRRPQARFWGPVGLVLATALVGAGCTSPPSGGPPGTTVVDCELDVECTGSVDAAGSSITVLAEAGSATQLKIGVNNSAPLDCPDYTELNPNQYLIDVPAQDRPKAVTITIDKAIIDAVPNFQMWMIQQCYGAPTQFDSLSFDEDYIQPAPFNPVTNEYEGLLPMCWWGTFPAPCIDEITRLDDGEPGDGDTQDGDVQIRSLLPGGDPRMK
jgi:hypothetical protein